MDTVRRLEIVLRETENPEREAATEGNVPDTREDAETKSWEEGTSGWGFGGWLAAGREAGGAGTEGDRRPESADPIEDVAKELITVRAGGAETEREPEIGDERRADKLSEPGTCDEAIDVLLMNVWLTGATDSREV